MRQLRIAELDRHVTPVGNSLGVVQSLRRKLKDFSHLLFALDVELTTLITHPVLIRHLFAGLDTQQNIVTLHILRIGIVNIVGRHKPNP